MVQNFRSAPQKQPNPNSASAIPCGNGGAIRAWFTKCLSGTIIGTLRPGSACSAVGMTAIFFSIHTLLSGRRGRGRSLRFYRNNWHRIRIDRRLCRLLRRTLLVVEPQPFPIAFESLLTRGLSSRLFSLGEPLHDVARSFTV